MKVQSADEILTHHPQSANWHSEIQLPARHAQYAYSIEVVLFFLLKTLQEVVKYGTLMRELNSRYFRVFCSIRRPCSVALCRNSEYQIK